MKKLTFILVMGVLLGFNSCVKFNPKAATISGQQDKSFKRVVTKTYEGRYLVYLPKDYNAKSSQRWPLILFLHGLGERGSNLELVKKHGPPKILESKKDFPFIVVSPQCPDGQWWSNNDLLPLLDEIMEKYAADPERVYLTGLSMGGFGTWSLALENPERFAAIAPICGGGNPYAPWGFDAARAQALRTLPIWVFHGAKDETVRLQESERMVNVLKAFGCQVQYTFYPDAGHDSWSETYANSKLYEWFLEHKRTGPKAK